MTPFYVQHKETGDQFLVIELITAAKITGIQVQILIRYYAWDPAKEAHVLDPEDFAVIGLMPPPDPNVGNPPAEEGHTFSGLILPAHFRR